MFRLADGRDKLYQWDSNIKLLVDENFGLIDEVHFASRFSRASLAKKIVVENSVSYVVIPNILLTKSYDIFVYAYVHGDDGNYTKFEKTFEVISRPKPSGYIYTETDVLNYLTLSNRIDLLSGKIPTVFDWAKKELFDKADLVDPAGINSFLTIDGVEYYRYNCGPNNFEWNNPKPYPGSVTITARAVSQYGGTNGTRLLTIYDDGTYGPALFVIVGGESKTVTVTTDPDKTLAKITGNYDMENWALLDMSVMSCVANYNTGLPLANSNAPGGVITDPATEEYTVPAKIGKNGKMYVPHIPVVDATLTQPGQAADAAAVGEQLSSLSGNKVNMPKDESGVSQNGTDGQILQTNGDGTTQWVDKPTGGGGVSGDYIPVPSTAEVGQTIVVKAVDENGKPTEWEAADMASGVGEKPWRYDKLIEFSEDTAGFTLDTFDDGSPFDFTEIEVRAALKNASENAVWGDVRVHLDGTDGNNKSHIIGGSNSSVSSNVASGKYYMCVMQGHIDLSAKTVLGIIVSNSATTYVNAAFNFVNKATYQYVNYSYSIQGKLNVWEVAPTKLTSVTSSMTIGAGSSVWIRGR